MELLLKNKVHGLLGRAAGREHYCEQGLLFTENNATNLNCHKFANLGASIERCRRRGGAQICSLQAAGAWLGQELGSPAHRTGETFPRETLTP